MTGLFITTFALGVVFCATPGAVNSESLRRGMARGFWPALLVQVGSLLGDTLWAIVALTGSAFLVQNPSIRLVLGVAGGFFLARLAFSALRDAFTGDQPAELAASTRRDFLTGLMFSLTNPFAIAFWLGIGGGMIASTTNHATLAGIVVFFAGFESGAVLWCAGSAAAIAGGRRFLGGAVFRWINALCGLSLGYFSLKLLWQTLRSLRYLRLVIG